MTTETTPQPDKLVSSNELCIRYREFSSNEEAKRISIKSLRNWINKKGFPTPVTRRPKMKFKASEVRKWEIENKLEFLGEIQ